MDSKNVAERFGAFIKAGRLRKKITQVEAAAHLNMSQSYYNYIEAGIRNIDLSLAMDICNYYDLDLNDFVKSYQNYTTCSNIAE